MTTTAPCDLSAVDARAAIGRRELSPVELLESCIARIEAVDHAVCGVVVGEEEIPVATHSEAATRPGGRG